MVYFHTKNPNLGKLWSAVEWNFLVYLMGSWIILRLFGIVWGHLVYFYRFGMSYQETSGNPGFANFAQNTD
jgi:hypothetical protein